MQQPISSPNILRALGFSTFGEQSQVQFEGSYSENSSVGSSYKLQVATTRSPVAPIDVFRSSERTVTRQNSTDSIDIDRIEELISKRLESGGADLQFQPDLENNSTSLPQDQKERARQMVEAAAKQQAVINNLSRKKSEGIIDIDSIEKLISGHLEFDGVDIESPHEIPADNSTMNTMVPIDVNSSSEKTIDSIEKLITRHLELNNAALKSKPDFNRQSSDLRTSCRLTSSERELLDDLFRPIGSNSTSLPQDQGQSDPSRQDVEAAADQQAVIVKKVREARLREEEEEEEEEEERRIDLLTKQAHREAMEMAEHRFIAAEAEKKRLQQEAADNELKVRIALEETQRREQERLHDAEEEARRKNETEKWEREVLAATTAANEQSRIVMEERRNEHDLIQPEEAAIDAAAVTTEALVASPSVAAEVVEVADALVSKGNDNLDDQHLPVPAASGEAAEADQVSTLKKQIEEKKASLLLAKAKEATREPEGDDAAIAKAPDDAAATAKVAPPNMKASEYTGKASTHPLAVSCSHTPSSLMLPRIIL